jgi:cell division protein FtsB
MHFNIKMNHLVKIIKNKPIINQKVQKKEKENPVLHQKRKTKKDRIADKEDKEVAIESN